MKKKFFLISVDVEGDNLWEWDKNSSITSHNAKYLVRFQLLCEKYGFKPTYLTNYEMATNDFYVNFIKTKLNKGFCEVGMHLHAWNSPPLVELPHRDDGYNEGLPYIIEYNSETIEDKVAQLTDIIRSTFNVNPITHRSGRWATNNLYAKVLEKYGYKYDCSITPGLDWGKCCGQTNGSFGNNYSFEKNSISCFYDTSILEIPFQSYADKRIKTENIKGPLSFLKILVAPLFRKQIVQLRPNGRNINDLLYIVNKNKKSTQKYLMFMIHSSELMPFGSPYFQTEQDIEKLYTDLMILFDAISKDYVGITIGDFGDIIRSGYDKK